MKNFVVITLLILFIFTLPVLANPLADVPLNHWAYDAVQNLAAKGIITGYPDGTFGGNRVLTRNEFAEAIARAIGYLESSVDSANLATQEDLKILEKLIQEFADELQKFGVTVEDIKNVVGENSQAIQALNSRVSELESYAEPLKVTGELTTKYTGYVPADPDSTEKEGCEKWPKTGYRLEDQVDFHLLATINEFTTSGLTLTVTDTFTDNPSVSADHFYVEYKQDPWYIRFGRVQLKRFDLGLVLGLYRPADPESSYALDFDGFYIAYQPEGSEVAWKAVGSPNDFYMVRAEWEDAALALTWMPEGDELYSPENSDLIVSAAMKTDFNQSDVRMALEGAYGVLSDTYGLAGELAFKVKENATITLSGRYITEGFIPVSSQYVEWFDDTCGIERHISRWDASNRMIFTLPGNFQLSREGKDQEQWKLSFGYTYGEKTTTGEKTSDEVNATLTYIPPQPVSGESATLRVNYYMMKDNYGVFGGYRNYPLEIQNESQEAYISANVQYVPDSSEITAVGELRYRWLEEKTTLTFQGRYDSSPKKEDFSTWGLLTNLEWEMAKNTRFSLGYELNTWDGSLFAYDDDRGIIDKAGTMKAELKVSF